MLDKCRNVTLAKTVTLSLIEISSLRNSDSRRYARRACALTTIVLPPLVSFFLGGGSPAPRKKMPVSRWCVGCCWRRHMYELNPFYHIMLAILWPTSNHSYEKPCDMPHSNIYLVESAPTRRIYVRPRTGPQSAYPWWPAVAKRRQRAYP